jgi:uncharacterized protein (TIGR04141 family)
MKDKFGLVGLRSITKSVAIIDGWSSSFYFSDAEEPKLIPWVQTFPEFFDDGTFNNLIYFGVYIFEKDDKCFALSFGKGHFYIRPFGEHDFGINLAKRIANESDIKQTSSKRFSEKMKKEIKSFTPNSKLDIESGESIDYIQASILTDKKDIFGRTGKFGASLLINPPIEKAQLPILFENILDVLNKPENFKLPRTDIITIQEDLVKYDSQLIDAILADEGSADFSHNTHDLFGVDFIFSGNESYTLMRKGNRPKDYDDLNIADLYNYIHDNGIAEEDIFDIKIKVRDEFSQYTKNLKESLDYIVDSENVLLSQGRWVRFNEDYLQQLDEYIESIDIEETENSFRVIETTEGEFNQSEELKSYGYINSDKDFSKIKINSNIQIEAWDLEKENTVYAVKLGKVQKLSYVCDQAIAVLEIIRNKANLKILNTKLIYYCLWFGFDQTIIPTKISTINSIIFKQKVVAWARKCREVGIEPKIKISQKIYRKNNDGQ